MLHDAESAASVAGLFAVEFGAGQWIGCACGVVGGLFSG